MKANYLKFVLPVILWLFTFGVYAQSYTVTGVVKDANDRLGLPGVNVIEKGTQNGTITDFDGNYKITLLNNDGVLQFSFIGYKTMEVPVNGQALLNVDMTSELTELDELVVIGYGIQKKKVVTGAIASIGEEAITSTPILRVEQAMQGRMTGVQVTNLSGQPGEAPTVRIRGAGTTGDATPLYVVDGMVVENIEFLNPNDIQSMDVLKDAGSAAIYGARAGNGVVLVTTKKGTKGKMNLTYSGYQGIQNTSNRLKMLDADQYRELMNDGARNSGLTEPFDMNEIALHNTDWQDLLFVKNAPMMEHNLSITGANEVSSYAASIAYFKQEGIIGGDKSQFERISSRFNSTHKVNNWFTFGNNFSYTHMFQRGIASNQSFNGAYSSALNLDPLTPLYQEDADILSQYPYSDEPVVENADGKIYGISELLGAEIVNPLALMEIQTAKSMKDRIVGDVYGEIEFIKDLKFKTSLGLNLEYLTMDSYRPLFYLNDAQNNTEKTSVSKEIRRYQTWQWENVLSYNKQLGDHLISGLVGTTASEWTYQDLSGFNAKVPVSDPEHVYLHMATDTVWTADGRADHSALFSQFGRVTYDYKSRYAFTGIMRRDGSSKFGPNYRYGIFSSFGFSWLISDEPFMPSLGPISYLKLRASYGTNGNDRILSYRFVSSIDKSRGYIFGGGRVTGASPGYLGNADVHWEESEQLDIALDFGAYENRLTATIDYYIKNTNGLLETVSILGHVGNSPPTANVGSVRNSGIELELNWRHTYSNNLKYSIGANASYNKNEMTFIANEDKVITGASWAIAGTVTRAEEGLPLPYFWGYKTDGIFQNNLEVFQHIGKTGSVLQPNAKPGDVRFLDVNNDGALNEDDRTMLGKPTPDWTLGFNGSVEYKQFDFSFMFTGALGFELFNGTQRQDLRYTNRTEAMLNRWTGEGTSNEIPRYTWIDVNNNNRISDLYIEDGSYLRLKNIQFGYNIPTTLLQQLSISNWRFYLSAENLYTITGYTGVDPEIGALSSFDIGIDRGIYPQPRTFRIGTVVTF